MSLSISVNFLCDYLTGQGLYKARHETGIIIPLSHYYCISSITIEQTTTMHALLGLLVATTVILVSGKGAEKLAPRFLDEFSVNMMQEGLRIPLYLTTTG